MQIPVPELEKELKSEKLHSIYLLYGEELFLLESNLKKIKKLFGEAIKGINYIVIDETNVDSLISNIDTPAFGYEKKLIIVRNANLMKKEGRGKGKKTGVNISDSIAEYIKNNIDAINESVILVFIEETAEKNALYNIIEKLRSYL